MLSTSKYEATASVLICRFKGLTLLVTVGKIWRCVEVIKQ